MSSRWRATVSAASVVLALALTAGCTTSSRRHTTANGTLGPVAWRTYSSPKFAFSVRYPSTWQAAAYEVNSSETASVVYFSDQPMSSPCTTSASGSIYSCGANVVGHLLPGRLVVDWSTSATTSASLFAAAKGTPTTIHGLPAKISIGSDPICAGIGGITYVSAVIQRPSSGGSALGMGACIRDDRSSQQVALVLSSLRTARLT